MPEGQNRTKTWLILRPQGDTKKKKKKQHKDHIIVPVDVIYLILKQNIYQNQECLSLYVMDKIQFNSMLKS